MAAEEVELTRALETAERLAPARRAGVRLLLAKLSEHRLRDPVRALAHAAHTLDAEGREAHARRIKRLRSRMGELEGFARVNGRIVVDGTMTFALGPSQGPRVGE